MEEHSTHSESDEKTREGGGESADHVIPLALNHTLQSARTQVVCLLQTLAAPQLLMDEMMMMVEMMLMVVVKMIMMVIKMVMVRRTRMMKVKT